jgi:hypothetical protein
MKKVTIIFAISATKRNSWQSSFGWDMVLKGLRNNYVMGTTRAVELEI